MFSRFELRPHAAPQAGQEHAGGVVSMEKIPPTEASLGEAVTVNLTASKIISMSKGMFGPLSPGHDNRAYDLYGIWQPVRLVVTGGGEDRRRLVQADARRRDDRRRAHAPASGEQIAVAHKLTDAKTGEKLAERSAHVVQRRRPQTERTASRSRTSSPSSGRPPSRTSIASTSRSYAPKGIVLDQWTKQGRLPHVRGQGQPAPAQRQALLAPRRQPVAVRQEPVGPGARAQADPASCTTPTSASRARTARRGTRRGSTPPTRSGWPSASRAIRPWALVGKIGPTPPEMMKHWLMENADIIKRLPQPPVGADPHDRQRDDAPRRRQRREVEAAQRGRRSRRASSTRSARSSSPPPTSASRSSTRSCSSPTASTTATSTTCTTTTAGTPTPRSSSTRTYDDGDQAAAATSSGRSSGRRSRAATRISTPACPCCATRATC